MTPRARLRGRRIRPWRQWPLRHRMVVTIAWLAAVALIVADGAGAALLQSYLVGRLDSQLAGQAHGLSRVGRFPGGQQRLPRAMAPFGGPDSRVYVYNSSGERTFTSSSTGTDEPRLGSFASLKGHAGHKAYTVD